ncbi:MAG: DUF4956 domain-containing protein [Spirochaetaceae bacterium]|nr:DUF4956 domain-containing protein [Spirochaetaceae bacterium]
MTFKDIIEGGFLDHTESDLTILAIVATLFLSFSLGMFIFWIYKRTYQGVMYSKTFNISLIGLAMITSSVILAVTSNIILSLGMVGALSIVRFRTAIKDPIDVIYMFWAIAVGIISGAGLFQLALVFTLTIGTVLFIFSKINIRNEPYLLIVNYSNQNVEDTIFKLLNDDMGNYKIKSKSKSPESFELTVEIRSTKDKTHLVNTIDQLPEVNHTAMISYDGEYAA